MIDFLIKVPYTFERSHKIRPSPSCNLREGRETLRLLKDKRSTNQHFTKLLVQLSSSFSTIGHSLEVNIVGVMARNFMDLLNL